jgi:hypothetical protein
VNSERQYPSECSNSFDHDSGVCSCLNPEWPDPMPTESQVIVARINATASEQEKEEAKEAWAKTPEWKKQEIRDFYEFDLL